MCLFTCWSPLVDCGSLGTETVLFTIISFVLGKILAKVQCLINVSIHLHSDERAAPSLELWKIVRKETKQKREKGHSSNRRKGTEEPKFKDDAWRNNVCLV